MRVEAPQNRTQSEAAIRFVDVPHHVHAAISSDPQHADESTPFHNSTAVTGASLVKPVYPTATGARFSKDPRAPSSSSGKGSPEDAEKPEGPSLCTRMYRAVAVPCRRCKGFVKRVHVTYIHPRCYDLVSRDVRHVVPACGVWCCVWWWSETVVVERDV